METEDLSEPFVSVLVPAYNAEKHIKKCIDSITEQTYANLEILVLDDGSKDKTGAIADALARGDGRIRVLHEVNAGVAASRNKLIEASHGKFILQVDADDYISPEAVGLLYDELIKNKADMAVCTHISGDSEDYVFPGGSHHDSEVFSGDDKFRKLFDRDKPDFIVPWGKLYKRELFKGLKYPEGKIHEDEYLAHIILDRAQRTVYIYKPLFYYTVERKGITKSKFSHKRLDCVPALIDRNRFFEEKGNEELLRLCYMDFLKRFQYFYYGIRYHYPEEKDLWERLYGQYESVYRKALSCGMLSFNDRAMFGLFLKNAHFNYLLRKLLGKKEIDT